VDDGGALVLPDEGSGRPSQIRSRYAAGDVIGAKYRLERLLGAGGMGAVFEARNLVLGTEVAVKLVHRVASSPEAHARLLREARAAASLRHPSVVRVYDYGETERGDPFIVMEALRGGSLADLLDAERRLPAAYAVQVLLPVAAALAEAHGRGVVHRDLKPENVVLAQGEVLVPKVIDFGVAKLLGPEHGRYTRTGAVLGSPAYMSPEQARGRADVDARTDVWSLCVVLYEMITARRPFAGDNYHALLNAVIEDVPTPAPYFRAGDEALWAILDRGLAKSPDDRWPSMRSLGRALAAWAAAQGVETDVTGTSLSMVWLRDSQPSMPEIPVAIDPAPPAESAGHRPGLRADEPPYAPGPLEPSETLARVDTLPAPRPLQRRLLWWAALPAVALVALAGVALQLHAQDEEAPAQARSAAPAPRPPASDPQVEPAPPKAEIVAHPTSDDRPASPSAKPVHRAAPSKRAASPALPLPTQPDF
jgi:serine/threonine-protein kinase